MTWLLAWQILVGALYVRFALWPMAVQGLPKKPKGGA